LILSEISRALGIFIPNPPQHNPSLHLRVESRFPIFHRRQFLAVQDDWLDAPLGAVMADRRHDLTALRRQDEQVHVAGGGELPKSVT